MTRNQLNESGSTMAFVLPSPGIRDFDHRDRMAIMQMLRFLPDLYPGGSTWLEQRLDDVDRGKAYCSVVSMGCRVDGLLIETPKGRRESKISTLYIREDFRKLSLGSLLFERHRRRWLREGIDRVHITVPRSRLEQMRNFLHGKRFFQVADILDRYGPGRAESVFAFLN